MVQPITPELTALLVSKLQAGQSGFRARLEIDRVVPSTDPVVAPGLVQSVFGRAVGTGDLALPADVTPGHVLVYEIAKSKSGDPQAPYVGPLDHNLGGDQPWTQLGTFDRTAASGDIWTCAAYIKVANGSDPICQNFSGGYSTCGIWELEGCTDVGATVVQADIPGSSADLHIGSLGTPAAGLFAAMLAVQYSPDIGTMASFDPLAWTTDNENLTANFGDPRPFWLGHVITDGSPLEAEVTSPVVYPWAGIAVLVAPSDTGTPATVVTTSHGIASLDLDRSRSPSAGQLNALLPNELDLLGYYQDPDAEIVPNNPCRAYAWYGDVANEVQVFTGLLDRVAEHRNPRTLSITARSRMKWLLEQKFIATARQAIDDKVHVRTEANGVYIAKSPEYIVADILDRAGWPSADRDLAVSGVVIDEYDLPDLTSWAECIAGDNRLTTAAGFDFWEDELGVVHFGPNALADVSEPDPDYTFTAGVDVLALDHETDDVDRATRVKVTGPMTSSVPAWKEEWSTSVLRHPVGMMYVASQSAYVYAIDALTQYLSKIRQSDRKVVARWYLGAGLTYRPGGLTVDESGGVFYVLDGDWPFGGTTHAKVQKFDLGTKAHVASYSLPDGEWSAIKTDGSHLWLTNYGDDRLYKRSMTATAVSSSIYAGHTNPTGLYLDGTTIGIHFGTVEKFYLVDTSAPGTITGSQSTKGTDIFGGEMDTTTHADLYVDHYSSSSGSIEKFALTEEVTNDVVKWATDQALEDALGFQSGIADREHDLHPGDPDHAFEIRVAEYPMQVVNSEAQAQAVADAQLVLLSRLRRVLDLATLGNPAVQINDVLRYIDPVAGTDARWLLDSYRASMDGSGTYTTSLSALPWVAP